MYSVCLKCPLKTNWKFSISKSLALFFTHLLMTFSISRWLDIDNHVFLFINSNRIRPLYLTLFIKYNHSKFSTDNPVRMFASQRSDKGVIQEIEGDLFSADKSVSLAHCVASDLKMGAGIAITFRLATIWTKLCIPVAVIIILSLEMFSNKLMLWKHKTLKQVALHFWEMINVSSIIW